MKGVKSIIGLEDFDINRYLFNFFPKKKKIYLKHLPRRRPSDGLESVNGVIGKAKHGNIVPLNGPGCVTPARS